MKWKTDGQGEIRANLGSVFLCSILTSDLDTGAPHHVRVWLGESVLPSLNRKVYDQQHGIDLVERFVREELGKAITDL